MKITKITRKVTGSHYSNLEMTASFDGGISPEEAITESIALDKLVRQSLDEIREVRDEEAEKKHKKNELLSKIYNLIEAIENGDDLPF